MLLSETDAKTKQCRVMPPVPANVSHTLNGLNPAPWPMSCAASGCMHWRWGEPTYEDHTSDQQHKPNGDGWKWTHVATGDSIMGQHRWRRISERRGYCGLAGRP